MTIYILHKFERYHGEGYASDERQPVYEHRRYQLICVGRVVITRLQGTEHIRRVYARPQGHRRRGYRHKYRKSRAAVYKAEHIANTRDGCAYQSRDENERTALVFGQYIRLYAEYDTKERYHDEYSEEYLQTFLHSYLIVAVLDAVFHFAVVMIHKANVIGFRELLILMIEERKFEIFHFAVVIFDNGSAAFIEYKSTYLISSAVEFAEEIIYAFDGYAMRSQIGIAVVEGITARQRVAAHAALHKRETFGKVKTHHIISAAARKVRVDDVLGCFFGEIIHIRLRHGVIQIEVHKVE